MKMRKKIGAALTALSIVPLSMVDGKYGFAFAIFGLLMFFLGAYLAKAFCWQKEGGVE